MNNDDMFNVLLHCTPINILNCLSICKQTNSLNTPYFWKSLCETHYDKINQFENLAHFKKYKLLNGINKLSYITNYSIDELSTKNSIGITGKQLLDILIHTKILKKLTNLKIINVKLFNPLKTNKLEHIEIKSYLKGQMGIIRPFNNTRKFIYARSVICGNPL